eukprot:53996-Pelagomonas_calceolata.AAC.4
MPQSQRLFTIVDEGEKGLKGTSVINERTVMQAYKSKQRPDPGGPFLWRHPGPLVPNPGPALLHCHLQ